MGVYRRNNAYYIDYYLVNGRRKREKIGKSKKLAERVLEKRRTEVIEGKYFDFKRYKRKKLKEYSHHYVESYCKHNKATWVDDVMHLKQIVEFLGNVYIDEITPKKFEEFRKFRLGRGMKRSTVNRALASIKTMLNKAVEWHDLKSNPILNVKPYDEDNQRVRYLEKEELQRLLDVCPPHTRNVIVFAVNTGMRKSEIFHLKWSAIDFEQGFINVIKTKNKKHRAIPMTTAVKAILANIREHSHSEYVFTGKNGQRLNSVRKSFENALKKAKIENFHFHDTRHTFASYLAMEGVDLYVIKELLGHKSIEMTMRYAHLADEYKAKAITRLDQRFQSLQISLPEQLSYSDVIEEVSA